MPDTPAVALARILTEQDIASVEYAIAAVGSGLTGADLADLRAGWRQRDANTIIVALAASGYTLTPTPASGGSVDTGPGEQPSPSAVAEVSSPPDVTLGPGWDECASCGHYQSNHAAPGCYITLCRCREFRLPGYHGLVFTTLSGNPIHGPNLLPVFYRHLARLKLPKVPWHGLRHTAASVLLEAGVPLSTVSRVLGHASVRVTMDLYAHLTEDVMREAADGMERALRRVEG
jgi:hypothetical protein